MNMPNSFGLPGAMVPPRSAIRTFIAGGSGTERENLHGDAKGKGTSGSNREAESTDAPARGGLLRSSDEAG
jgi:hypothetical protein